MTSPSAIDLRRPADGRGDARPVASGGREPTAAAGCGSTSAWRPGVGKTYRMLEEAHRRRRARDRPRRRLRRAARPAAHASRCSTGSRSCPGAGSSTAGVVVEEMDTDAVIARRPDGRPRRRARPHERRPARRARSAGRTSSSSATPASTSSAPATSSTSSRSPTPSRRSPARRSTSACPTTILASADEVELVDMSPHALRQRMRHGNVYPPERAAGRARPVLHRAEPDGAPRARRCGSSPRRVDEQLERDRPRPGLGRAAGR